MTEDQIIRLEALKQTNTTLSAFPVPHKEAYEARVKSLEAYITTGKFDNE